LEEKEYIVSLALKGLKEVINNKYRYDIPQSCILLNEQYKIDNNSFRTFLQECCIDRVPGAKIEDTNCTKGKIHRVYKQWFRDNYRGNFYESTSEIKKILENMDKYHIIKTNNGNEYYKDFTLKEEIQREYKDILGILDIPAVEIPKPEDIDLEDEDYEEISVEERVVGIEKKVNIILIVVILTCLFSLLSMIFAINGGNGDTSYGESQGNDTTIADDYSYDTSAFKEISASDIKSESKNETIVVWLGRQGCSYCAAYAPQIKQVAEEYKITVRYIDFAKIIDFSTNPPTVSDNTAYNLITDLEGNGEWKGFGEEAMQGTPNTLIIKNNVIVGGVNGYSKAESIRSAFEAAGIKK